MSSEKVHVWWCRLPLVVKRLLRKLILLRWICHVCITCVHFTLCCVSFLSESMESSLTKCYVMPTYWSEGLTVCTWPATELADRKSSVATAVRSLLLQSSLTQTSLCWSTQKPSVCVRCFLQHVQAHCLTGKLGNFRELSKKSGNCWGIWQYRRMVC